MLLAEDEIGMVCSVHEKMYEIAVRIYRIKATMEG
jgi:hypothetical protein